MNFYEYDCECEDCEGTGVYAGLAEMEGVGVVCHTCGGTGEQHIEIEWATFTGRKNRPGIRRIIEGNPGIGVQADMPGLGGMAYGDWRAGKPFPPGSELRAYTCPAWWYQTVNYELKPCWDKCDFGTFSRCRHFGDKSTCWREWDAENRRGL